MRALVLSLCLGACASPVRYADRPPLWTDPDGDPIAVPSTRRGPVRPEHLRDSVFDPLDDLFAIRVATEARNVNALDEVPDSSWYEDPRRAAARAGRPFGPAEVGADPLEHPDPDGIFTIVSAKSGGSTRGFVVVDERGRRFVLKLDAPGYFALATSTEVVAARLVAAAGWRVPAVSLVELRRDQLRIASTARVKGPEGDQRALGEAELREILAGVPLSSEGRYRFSASAWIPGRIVGPYAFHGRRGDDANDRVAHEDRRELRGYRVFSAFLNNVDALEDNTLDAYVGAPGQGHLIHYQQDVGGAFGNFATGPLYSWMGEEAWFDAPRVALAFFALGGYKRAWAREEIEAEREAVIRAWPELGWFEAEHFDPRAWSTLWPNPAFVRATARDLYWGSKRVLSFSADELRAAIAAGRYRPAVAERLFDVLWERRRRIGLAFLDRVAPLEELEVRGDRLCFADLMRVYALDPRPPRYEVRGAGPAIELGGGRACVRLPVARGYQIVELRVRREGARRPGPPLRVHLMHDGARRRVLGLER